MDKQKRLIPQYVNAKAGMDNVNAQTIAKRVAQLTNGTPKDIHQKQLQKKRSLEIASMLQKIIRYKKQDREQIKQFWNKKIKQYNNNRPLQHYWAHFDFDMFYVACQLLDKPEKKDLPCAVGGQNSVLCTANYTARLFGVRSAMPSFIAKKLCPQLILFKPDFQKYRKYSDIFKQTLMKFDPNLQSHGLDEAYINLTQHLKNKQLKTQEQYIKNIRTQIYNKTGLTVSCGVGPNKMLAKMASQVYKPNGQFIIQNKQQTILQFMADKKIRKIPGIGPVNQFYLKGLKIQSAKDILENTDILAICFSQNSCQFFISAALGLGSIEHEFKQRKSVGKSQTFKPTTQKKYLQQKLLQLCEQVEHQLQELQFVTINVVLSYQYENYQRKDKTFNLDKYTSKKEGMFDAVVGCLRESVIMPRKGIRLLGVKCTSLMKVNQWKRKSLQSFFNRARQKQRYQAREKQMQKEKQKLIQKQRQRNQKTKQKYPKQHQTTSQTNKSNQQQQLSGVQTKSHQTIRLAPPAQFPTTYQQNTFINQIKQKSQFICPVCNQSIQCSNNISAFNRHIDKCLKGGGK